MFPFSPKHLFKKILSYINLFLFPGGRRSVSVSRCTWRASPSRRSRPPHLTRRARPCRPSTLRLAPAPGLVLAPASRPTAAPVTAVTGMTARAAPRPRRRRPLNTRWPRPPPPGGLSPSPAWGPRPPLPAPAPRAGPRTGSGGRWATGRPGLQSAQTPGTPRTPSLSHLWPAASPDKTEWMEQIKCWESPREMRRK